MKLHHVGIVVEDIEKACAQYRKFLGLAPLSEIVIDPLQHVKIQMCGNHNEVSLELIQPYGEDSPVQRFLQKGGGLYHLCFEVENIDRAISEAKSEGAICIIEPLPAAAFQDRKVAFLFYSGIGLIEFVEGSSL
jgi:methylmalonyl-CoA/ethylmalonyl-CoA epimerase